MKSRTFQEDGQVCRLKFGLSLEIDTRVTAAIISRMLTTDIKDVFVIVLQIHSSDYFKP